MSVETFLKSIAFKSFYVDKTKDKKRFNFIEKNYLELRAELAEFNINIIKLTSSIYIITPL